MSAHQGTNKPPAQDIDGLHQKGIAVTKIQAWGIQTKQGSFVRFPAHNLPSFEAYRIITFTTRKQAKQWLANDRYWCDKAIVVPIVITTKERGEV